MMNESDAVAEIETKVRNDFGGDDVEKGDNEETGVTTTRGDFMTPEGVGEGGGEATAAEMNRDVTEITSQSYGSKVKESCSGVCFGFILFFASIGLLIWNEGRTVKRMKDLDEGRESVLEFDFNNFTNASIPSTFENQLIHTVGNVYTKQIISDPIFGISSSQYNASPALGSSSSNNVTTTSPPSEENTNFLRISRSISMYQWKESSTSTTKKLADGSTHTETTYSYNMAWSSSLIDSSRFHEKSTSMTNPGSFPFQPFTVEAAPIYLGSDNIVLNEEIISFFNWDEPLDTIDIKNVPDTALQSRLTKHTSNGYFYKSGDNNTSSTVDRPNVGDTRITFTVVVPDTISIIARLFADVDKDGDHNLGTHTTDRGGALLLIKRGIYTAEEMFTQADADNTATAWILRVVGFLLMVFSILLILQPLATIVDIVPFVGDCVQSSMENCLFPIIAVIIALPTVLFVVALAWLAYRPYIAIPIMIISLGFVVFFYRRIYKMKQEQNNNNNNEMNDDDGPIKPHQYDSTTDNMIASSTFSPFNSPDHNHVNIESITDGNGGKTDDDHVTNSGVDGFAGVLDHPYHQPSPTTTAYYDKPTDQKNTKEEEDVVFK